MKLNKEKIVAYEYKSLRLPDRLFSRVSAGTLALLFFCGCAHGKAVKEAGT